MHLVSAPIASRAQPSALAEMLELRVSALEELALHAATTETNRLAIVMHGAEPGRALTAVMIAVGGAAMGREVTLFVALQAPVVLCKPEVRARGSWVDRVLTLLPKGAEGSPLLRTRLGGIGAAMRKKRIRDKSFTDLVAQLALAAEHGVRLYVCEESLELLGLSMDDLIDYPGIQTCTVATFVGRAMDAKGTMFF